MSLCGECKLPGNRHNHICVKCIWKATEGLGIGYVPVEALKTRWYEIEWDGERALDVCCARTGQHWERIEKADLGYAIRVDENYEILDGCRRLVGAAFVKGHSEVLVIVVPSMCIRIQSRLINMNKLSVFEGSLLVVTI